MATKIRVTKNDPPTKVSVSEKIIPSKGIIDEKVDLRDLISTMAAGNNTNLTTDDGKGIFQRLKGLVGEKNAQKLVTHVGLFNQRPEIQGLKPEDRVNQLYGMGSTDPDIAGYLKQGGSLGYGVGHGFRTSPLLNNMILAGRAPINPAGPSPVSEKIKLLVKNSTK